MKLEIQECYGLNVKCASPHATPPTLPLAHVIEHFDSQLVGLYEKVVEPLTGASSVKEVGH